MQTYLKTKPPIVQLLIFAGLTFGVFLAVSLIGVMVLTNITGIALLDMGDVAKWDAQNPNTILFIRGMMVIQFLGLFFIPSLLFAYFSDPKPAVYLCLKDPHHYSYWVLGIALLLFSIPLVEAIGLLNQKINLGGSIQQWMKTMEEDATRQLKFMLDRHSIKDLLANLFFIAVLAGVGEEIFFRGVLQRLFIRITKNPWVGIIITAILFSGFHFQFFGFFPRLLLGILLGALYWYSGSLWTAILAHFFYDALLVTLIYIYPHMLNDPAAGIIDSSRITVMAAISFALTSLLVWQLIKKSKSGYEQVYKDDHLPPNPFSF